MAQTDKGRIDPATSPASSYAREPWVPSGVLTASTELKTSPGVFGGLLVTITDTGGDADVIVWDSEDSTKTSDERICRVTITSTTANVQASWRAPGHTGVLAKKGIYVEVVAGTVQVDAYYR